MKQVIILQKIIIEHGEYIAIEAAGAYGMAMASQYNSRPRGAEVLVEGSRITVIRKAETIKDLISKEI